jgi:superfamily II DNA or RNA helicase
MVQQLRRIGGREQALVVFDAHAESSWVPHERLRWVRTAASEFARGHAEREHAERFRLRVLAALLERWHQNTGALGRLEIDPLPHQLHLVHHILSSGHTSWLIADDVGLGKTIEVGMLLSALGRRQGFERVLVVTPSGLTRQWQEEMSEKFGLSFEIYGRDFMAYEPNAWTVRERVVASIDRIKHENHAPNLLGSRRRWDLVIFDEAHRLTRKERGSKQESSQRYAIARALKARADDVLLLTATPHQGKEDRFRGLLELLRPEWTERLRSLDAEPDLLSEMIYRNRKADVTDAHGEFVFAGQTTSRIEVASSEEEKEFDEALQEYFREGYASASSRKTREAAAIGFVMTTFRKLAASSHAAILAALSRRLDSLRQAERDSAQAALDMEWDSRFEGEREESHVADVGGGEFFSGEIERLDALLTSGRELLSRDTKLDTVIHELIPKMLAEDSERKVLIFTEFKNTQDVISRALEQTYGHGSVGLINGGVTIDERREVVASFNAVEGHRFVVSTEAGGEGLNMHERCHTLINYDLPWNPMRLVQRVGRVYRYGQRERVVVFNIGQPDTLDGRVVSLIYQRLQQVSRDMAAVSDEYGDRLSAEILGELAELVDVRDVLEQAREQTEERSEERVMAAMERAAATQRMQSELLAGAASYDRSELEGEFELERAHVEAFVEGMLALEGLNVVERQFEGEVWRVELHDELRAALGTRAQTVRISASRSHARREGIRGMDFDEPLFTWLVDRALSRGFGGRSAFIVAGQGEKAVCASLLRWQDALGRARREEVLLTGRSPNGDEKNPMWLSEWLKTEAVAASRVPGTERTRARLAADLYTALDDELERGSNRYLHPMQMVPLAFALFN